MRDQLSCPALLVTVALVGTAAAPAFAQSLADVARKEAERRKHISEPAKVYTDKDLKSVPPPLNPSQATEAATASDGGQPADGTDADSQAGEPASDAAAAPAKSQEEWAAGMKERQDKLDRDQVLVEAVQNRINSLTADFTARDDPAQRALIGQDRQRALDELDRLHKDIADDQQAITDYQDEARRAGVPPGWLRN